MIRVILADDHAVVLDGLRLILNSEKDIRVVGAGANGREAMKLVREFKPDVVVMDIAMPELNGIDATQAIRAEWPETSVVILSAYSNAEYVCRAMKAGALAYLLKESAGREVVKAVQSVCAGRRYLSERISNIITDEFLARSAHRDASSPLDRLSARERQVMQMVAEGKSSAEIAEQIHLSPKTVDTYRSRLMQKLGLEGNSALIRFAISHGMILVE